jgi:uncharacterized protein YprB with RNaseH-like and TPR domain
VTEESLTLLSLPARAARDLTASALADAVAYADPDGVWLPDPTPEPRAYATVRDAVSVPVVHPQLGRDGDSVVRHARVDDELAAIGPDAAADFDVLTVQSSAVVDDLTTAFERGERRPARERTLLVVPGLGVETDATSLSATLTAGEELTRLRRAVETPVTVLAGDLPAGYHHDWTLDGTTLPLYGCGSPPGHGETPTFAALRCVSAGTVAATPMRTSQFGLRALAGIGATTATRLRDRGLESRSEVRETPVRDLVDVSGVSRTNAERMHAHAEVLATGDPLRLTNETLPVTRDDRPPVCLDIETDGLSPTIIWQIGVYDPHDDSYQSFVERENPDDPGTIIEAFLDWFLATHADRTVLTWNGYRFDYPEIERFIDKYAPHYAEAWEEVWTYDLYKWAVRDENALLPGRTNKLDDVAAALGFEGADTGLSGAQTAAAYQQFMRTGDPSTVEWERHERYCEDDCRALWHVYAAIRDADRRATTDTATDSGGTQAGLGDF